MRFATYRLEGGERFGLVLRDSRDGRDWVFDPVRVEALADLMLTAKGAGSPWYRPRFMLDGQWPGDLTQLLTLDQAGIDAARRMDDFLRRVLEDGDPLLLRRAGQPVDAVELLPPIPRPRLLLGVVGNNAGFLRMDTARARNLHEPSCHQRPVTSLVGAGQPIVVPAESPTWAGTVELGVVIGRGGREISREQARHHLAGYTVVNDGLPGCYARRWTALDGESPQGAPTTTAGQHFHALNTASWLDKAVDTMCAVGPYLVTPDEVGDPYDLMAWYREGGVQRARAHAGALSCGIEELIHWLSTFVTLEPGMVLHLGAMGQDGIVAVRDGSVEPVVEAEIERIGVLRNPLIWGGALTPRPPLPVRGRGGATTGVAGDLPLSHGRERGSGGEGSSARHLWALSANHPAAVAASGIEPRPYPLAYCIPPTALAASGSVVRLPERARTIQVTCELGIVVGSVTHGVSSEEVTRQILGFVVLAVLRDSSFADALVRPHLLSANMPEVYARWPDRFNIVGESPVLVDVSDLAIRCAVDGVGQAQGSTAGYLLGAETVISELARWITLLPGDVIALGSSGVTVTLPDDAPLAAGCRVRASIDGIGEVTAILDDRRRSAAAARTTAGPETAGVAER